MDLICLYLLILPLLYHFDLGNIRECTNSKIWRSRLLAFACQFLIVSIYTLQQNMKVIICSLCWNRLSFPLHDWGQLILQQAEQTQLRSTSRWCLLTTMSFGSWASCTMTVLWRICRKHFRRPRVYVLGDVRGLTLSVKNLQEALQEAHSLHARWCPWIDAICEESAGSTSGGPEFTCSVMSMDWR
jgi:hypothetical protein